LALLFAFALSSSGKLAATSLGGDAPGVPTQSTSTVNVTLIGEFSPVEPQSAASETQSFEKFLDMSRAESAIGFEPLSAPKPKRSSLAEALGEDLFKPKASPAAAPHRAASQSAAAQGAASQSVQANASAVSQVKVDGRTRQTPNDLWKAIEPCWRRLADQRSVPVTLELSFSPLGNLAKPPVIRRTQGQPLTDQLLRSESQAIAALTQCGPYLMALGQSGVDVTFPKL
jgi:hypothetical protein